MTSRPAQLAVTGANMASATSSTPTITSGDFGLWLHEEKEMHLFSYDLTSYHHIFLLSFFFCTLLTCWVRSSLGPPSLSDTHTHTHTHTHSHTEHTHFSIPSPFLRCEQFNQHFFYWTEWNLPIEWELMKCERRGNRSISFGMKHLFFCFFFRLNS